MKAAIDIDDDPSEALNTQVTIINPDTFPDLTTLTIGAIFGGQDGVWETMANHYLKSFGHRKIADEQAIFWDLLGGEFPLGLESRTGRGFESFRAYECPALETDPVIREDPLV